MKEFWNSRYAEEDYVYGTEPNVFFKSSIEEFKPEGPALMPADGEGRNGVYAAKLGYDVTCFDISETAKEKAIALAESEGVNIQYHVGSFEDLDLPEGHFGFIGLISAHFPSQTRKIYHQKCMDLLKPGGMIILEAFSQHHLRYNKKNPQAGGPKDLNLLYSKEDIYSDFKNMEIVTIGKKVYTLNEGKFHVGEGAVIRFVGRKK